MKKFRDIKGFLAGLVWLTAFSVSPAAFTATANVLILHSNDVHDHLRPGYIGIGGLPYLSGFVNLVRSERGRVLLVDSGDLLEKGDLLAYRTHGATTFEAMGRIGYDAITVGNHDLDFGVDHLKRLEKAFDSPLLLLNLVDTKGKPIFEPSRVVELDGLKVGLIGMLAPRKKHIGGLDHEESGRRLALEAERLKEEVHLVIAVSHEGSAPLKSWSTMAPDVDVFIAGHHHETIFQPMVVENTGAIIVSAGSDAHWLGHLELQVDLMARKVNAHSGGLNLLRHDQIPIDQDLANWLYEQEQDFAPESSQFVIESTEPIGWFAIARLAADAIREKSDADIGFFHPGQIIRNSLPAGKLDYNAIFRVAAERVDPILELEMTGGEVSAYMDGLSLSEWGQTQWSGFRVDIMQLASGGAIYSNKLDPDKVYKVVMPEREWRRYVTEIFEPAYVRVRQGLVSPRDSAVPRREFPGNPVEFAFAEAFSDYLGRLESGDQTIQQRLKQLQAAQGSVDPNESSFEPRFVRLVSPEAYFKQAENTTPLILEGLKKEADNQFVEAEH